MGRGEKERERIVQLFYKIHVCVTILKYLNLEICDKDMVFF